MYRMQTEKLQYNEEQEERSGPDRAAEILQILQKTHTAQRNEIRCKHGNRKETEAHR